VTTVAPAGVPLRRRVDRLLLRWEARLETQTGDRWIPGGVGVVLGSLVGYLALARVEALDAGAALAGYAQALWLISHGHRPEVSVFGGIHLLELHWSFIVYPLAPLARVGDPAQLLVVVQAVALGLGVVPLWRLARHVCRLRVGAATVVLAAYALHPVTWRLGVADFQPESLAVPGLIALLYAASARRWAWYWLAVALVLACRADLGLAVAGFGFVLLGDGERRAGLWSIGIGSFWSLSLLLVVQPLMGDAEFAGGQYATYGGSLAEVTSTMVRNPGMVLGDLAAEENLGLIVAVLAPVIFLPLLAIRYLLPALPLLALYLLADTTEPADYVPERNALLLAFVIVASAFALKRVGTMGVDRVFVDGRILAAVVMATGLLFLTESPASPYQRPWQWRPDATAAATVRAAELLEPEVAVRASRSALVPLAERPWLYELRGDAPLAAAAVTAQARAVLLVEADNPLRDAEHREQFTAGMSQLGYEVVFGPEHGVTLFKRP
jgi:uncharacterized membrane protein